MTATAARTVSFTDVANLLAAVPAADRFGGDYVIMPSPGAYDDLLAASAGAAKSVVAGNITQSYAIRLAPLRVDIGRVGAATDTMSVRTVLRADGRRQRTTAAAALVHL